jgi:CheY-like chemotaxis protein
MVNAGMAPKPPLLLLVEDTLPVARAFMKRAETLGWKVVWADRLDDARSLVARVTFDAWVLDRQLGHDEGMTLVREHELAEKTGLRRRRPAAVLWTSRPDDPPGDIDEFDVHVFGKTDIDAMLAHLAARLPPPLRQSLRL